MTDLIATTRDIGSKTALKRLRDGGQVPGIMYGKKHEAMAIALDRSAFEHAWHEAGESTVVTVKGLDKDTDVLIHDVEVDPVYGHPVHVDLYAVDQTTAVEVAVPLVFEGVAPAEKELGGTLIKVIHELQVSALPKDLPSEIMVDINGLKTFEDQVHARDLKMPSGVEMVTDADEVVALVQEVKEEVEEEVEAPDMESIEVEQKGKKEEEGEAENKE